MAHFVSLAHNTLHKITQFFISTIPSPLFSHRLQTPSTFFASELFPVGLFSATPLRYPCTLLSSSSQLPHNQFFCTFYFQVLYKQGVQCFIYNCGSEKTICIPFNSIPVSLLPKSTTKTRCD